MKPIILKYLIFSAVVLFTIANSTFIVDQRQKALVVQFGEVMRLVEKPGLKFKIPFMQDVLSFDNRILDLGINEQEVIAADQKRLIIERKKRGIYKVNPGITGLAQVFGINMSTPVLLAKTDLKMIKQMNLFYYFYYIFKTVLLIFRKRS